MDIYFRGEPILTFEGFGMLRRIKNAWRGLMDDLPVKTVTRDVEVAVLGEPHRATLYRADPGGVEYGNGWVISYNCAGSATIAKPEYDYYATCEQAHSAAKGGAVKKVDVIRIGARYFVADRLQEVKIGAKPKREKGKRG